MRIRSELSQRLTNLQLVPTDGQELSDRVVRTLRPAILSGELPRGIRLIEEEIAERLGVSRGPVREALAILQHEGLVTVQPRRGATVVGVTERDILELYDLRRLLETHAAGLAAVNARPEDIDYLAGLSHRLSERARDARLDTLSPVDIVFHRHLFVMANQRRLRRAWEDLAGILEAAGVISAGFDVAGLNIFSALDALERRGVVTTLAEPTLVALSGETASFLAGGEFPIPVAQSGTGDEGGSISVEFKQFGVSLAFTPTVLDDGIINLVVEPEVSAIDRSAAVTVGGISIPGLSTRRARTTLELRDGQSFAMAGLLRRDFQDTVRQFPILGSIPIIGTLFRSTSFQNDDTELVIIVTPRLVRPMPAHAVRVPTDRVQPPNEIELFLIGRTDSAIELDPAGPPPVGNATQPVTRPPQPRAAPIGVEGDYGHIRE
jgi:DNA-binding GntR family transcriptional regulator